MRLGEASKRARLIFFGLAYGLLTAACSAAAYWHAFSTEVLFDEGYLLLSLKEFIAGQALFTDVYSQYGPAYYELWGGLFWALGIPVTPDAGRLATVVTWVLTSLCMGVVVHRLTGRFLLGLAAMVSSFGILNVITHAPMHPGGTTSLGLVLIVGIGAFVYPSRPRAALVAIGAVAAAIALMKVNVGGLALLAVVFAACMTYGRPGWTAVRGAAVVLYLAAPLVLLGADLSLKWVATFAATVIAGGAALALAAPLAGRDPAPFNPLRSLGWVVAGAAALTAASILLVVVLGTRLSDLVDGVLIAPTRQRDAFLLPFGVGGPDLVWSALGLAAAAAVVVASRRALAVGTLWTGLGRLAAGALVLVGGASSSFFTPHPTRMAFALPLAWVAAIPPRGDGPRIAPFVRVLVPALAVLQPLHTYPVSGAQVAWGWLMFVPAGALCIADGWRELEGAAITLGNHAWRRAIAVVPLLLAAALAAKYAVDGVARPLRSHRSAYDNRTPLPFEGSTMIRLPLEQQQPLTATVAALRARCPTFLTLPGMNSFYLWTQRDPPTGMNTTSWMYLLDAQQQQRVVDAVKSVPELCLLTHRPELDLWRQGRPLPDRPLVRFTSSGFRPVQKLPDEYVLSVRGR